MPWVWSDDFKNLLDEQPPDLAPSLLTRWAEHPVAYSVTDEEDVTEFISGLVRSEVADLERG